MPDTLTESLYSALLTNHEIKPAWFNIKSIRQAFFKCVERKAVVIPGDLSTEQAEDEIYSGKKKLVLRFFLPRGSFGTMLIKRLFSQYHHQRGKASGQRNPSEGID
jgi:tRNA pseudouridine13 synthase